MSDADTDKDHARLVQDSAEFVGNVRKIRKTPITAKINGERYAKIKLSGEISHNTYGCNKQQT